MQMKTSLHEIALRLGMALKIRPCYWVIVVSLFLTTFTVSRLLAPQLLPHLLEYQSKHPRVSLVKPTPLIVRHSHAVSVRAQLQISEGIYRHNIKAALYNGLGSLIFFPFAVIKATVYSFTLGLTAYVDGWGFFLIRILPHSILEFPVIWLIASRATMSGWRIFIVPWRQKLGTIQKETVEFVMVWVVAAILLIPAALLETFGRAVIRDMFF